MYADRYGPRQIDGGSLTLSTIIVGGLLAAAMLSNTVIEHVRPDKPLETYRVPPDAPPPKPEPRPQPQPRRNPLQTLVVRPDPTVPTRTTETNLTTTVDPGPLPPLDFGTGATVTPPLDSPKPVPVLRGADIDSRYFRDFQPTYPTEERRAGREGVVTLKVLIGVDGRVREVERVVAPSDAFWRVTEQRALAKWRFRPATRDGIPYETWKTMTVRFTLQDEE